MTITNGLETKRLSLYPPAIPHLDIGKSQWKSNKTDFDQPINLVLTIDTALALRCPQEDTIISNFF